jgi:hypothetical protein
MVWLWRGTAFLKPREVRRWVEPEQREEAAVYDPALEGRRTSALSAADAESLACGTTDHTVPRPP